MAQETPTSTSSSGGQAVQLEATTAAEDLGLLKVIDDGLALHVLLDDSLQALHDPQGHYSAELAPRYDVPNAPVPDSAHVFPVGNSTDQEYESSFLILDRLVEKDRDYILKPHNIKDRLEDCNTNHIIKYRGVDEDDQVNGKSSGQNNLSPGTKGTDNAESATLLQQNVDFSPTATAPNDISVRKVITSSSEPLQKPEEVEEEGVSIDDVDHTSFSLEPDPDIQKAQNPTDTELVSQTGDVVNMVTVNDETKEDEENGGIVLNQMDMLKGGTNEPLFSTFGAVDDKPAPATGATSPRLAVASLEPLPKRAKVIEEGMLVNVGHTSSSSSAARP